MHLNPIMISGNLEVTKFGNEYAVYELLRMFFELADDVDYYILQGRTAILHDSTVEGMAKQCFVKWIGKPKIPIDPT